MEFEVKVLDHGFVRLRNLAGPTRRGPMFLNNVQTQFFDADDSDAPNAARMSFDQTDVQLVTLRDGSQRTRTGVDDHKLAEYLMKNRHTSPFEMIQVWLEMKLPIFVARQFVRHRTVRLNEVSGRYVTLPAEWYIPDVVGGKAKSAKQGQEDNLDAQTQHMFKGELNAHCEQGYKMYLDAIEAGVAPEEARLFLSLNHYTHWLWNQDLHNLMHFLSLRDHGHAQKQAQAYAVAVDQLIRQHLPLTMELYDKYRRQP